MTVDLSEFLPPTVPKLCKVGRILSELVGERHDKLAAALADPSITHKRISEVMKSWGCEVGDTLVSRHRDGACRCD